MKFTLCLAALISVAVALPVEVVAPRATTQDQVAANAPAMSDANGNVVPFNAASVNLSGAK